MRTGLRRRLGALLLVTDDEWPELGAFTAAQVLMVFGAVLGLSSADALFMQYVGAAMLPWTFVLTGAVMIVCTPCYLWMTSRLSRRGQLTATFLVLVAILAMLPGFFPRTAALWAYVVLTVVVHGFSSLAFWVAASDRYDPRQARRLFHVIGAGGSGGAILAGLSSRWIAVHLDTSYWPLIWCVCLLAALGLLAPRACASADPCREATSPLGPLRQSLHGLRGMRRVPLTATLVWTTAIGVLVGWLIDYEFLLHLQVACPDPPAFAIYYAQLEGAVSVFTLLAQLGGVGRLTTRLGIVGAMLLPPIILLGPTVLLALDPSLPMATACRFLEQFLGLAIVSACVDSLSAAIPTVQRTRVMALLRSVVTPLAMSAAGAVLLAAHVLPAGATRLTVPLLVVLWLVVLRGLRRRYLDTLISNLAASDDAARLSSLEALDKLSDGAVDTLLIQSLGARRPEVVLFALGLVREPGFERLSSAVSTCLESPHADVRAEAIATLACCAPGQALAHAWPLLRDPHERVRAAAVCCIDRLLDHRSLGSPAAARLVQEGPRHLRDESAPDVAATLISTLARAGWPQEEVRNAVSQMLARGERPWRLAAANALAGVSADDPPREVDALLHDADLEIRSSAARAIRGPFSPSLMATLVSMLREPALAEAAAHALSTCGAGGVDALAHSLETEPRIAARVHLCEILGRIASPRAIEAVLLGLRDRAARVRAAATASLREARVPMEYGDLAPPVLATAEHLVTCALLVDALRGKPRTELLTDELEHEMVEARQALSTLISLAAWGKAEDAAHALLQPPSEERARGISLELVDNALHGPARDAVLAVMEADDDARLAALDIGGSQRWRPMALDETLTELSTSEDQWVARCARWALEKEEEHAMLSLMEKILFLRQVDLFRAIAGRDLAVIADLASEQSFERDRDVFLEGAPGDALYLIVTGSVAVITGDRIIQILGERECFGEMAILSGEPRSATIRAVDATRVLIIRRADFRHLIMKYPHIAFPIFEILSRRIKTTTEMVKSPSGRGIRA